MAFQAGAIVSQLQLDRKKFSASIKGAGKEVKGFGGMVRKSSATLKKMGVAVTALGATALFTFSKMVKKYVEVGDMIDKMSKRTAFSAETLSELAHAAEISGADITALEKGVKKMSKSIVDASYGLETYLRVFRGLGLEVEDLMALSPEEQFMRIGNAIADMENDTLRTAAAVDVFGRAGTMLIPLFKEGSEGIQRLREEARKLGIVFDEEAAAKAAKLKDAQTALSGAFRGLGFALAEEFIPILTDLTEQFTDMVVDIGKNAKTLVTALLEGFKVLAIGVQGLILAFHELKRAAFSVGEDIAKFLKLLIKAIELQLFLSKNTKLANEFLLKTADLYELLTIIEKGYVDTQEDIIDKEADIISFFDDLIGRLEDVKASFKDAKDETKGFSETIVTQLLPAGKNMSDVLMAAGLLIDDYIVGWEEATDKTKDLTEAQSAALYALRGEFETGVDIMLGTFERWATEGGDIMGHLGNAMKEMSVSLLGTMRGLLIQSMSIAMKDILVSKAKAIAAVIASVIKAIPFPLNIAMIGTAIGLISKFFAGLPKFAEGGDIGRRGGIVGEKGPEAFFPDRPGTIVPLREKGAVGQTIVFSPNISPVMHISAMDNVSVADFIRNKGIPEIVEALRLGINLRELQDALKMR